MVDESESFLKPFEAIQKSDFEAVSDSLSDFWVRVMTKRSTGYLSHLFDLIGQHKILNNGQISDKDQIANQIMFLETMAQQYIALLQLIFPEFNIESFSPRDKMMSPTQAAEVLANQNLENMRFGLGALKPFISQIEMIYSHLMLVNFPEGHIELTVFESHHEQIESDPEKFKFMVDELIPLLFQSALIPNESISFKYVSTPPYTLPTDVFNNSYGYILENLRVKSAPLSIAIKLKGINLELLREELNESAFEIEEKHMPLTMRQQKNLRRDLRLAKSSEDEEGYRNDHDEVRDEFWRSESEKIESASWKLDKKLGRFSLKRNRIQSYIAQIDKDC